MATVMDDWICGDLRGCSDPREQGPEVSARVRLRAQVEESDSVENPRLLPFSSGSFGGVSCVCSFSKRAFFAGFAQSGNLASAKIGTKNAKKTTIFNHSGSICS